MTKIAPDIKELKEAEKKIEEIKKLLTKIDLALDDLKDLGPRDVLAPVATHYKNMVDLENEIEASRLRVYHMKEGFQFHVLPKLFHEASVNTVKTLNGYTMTMSDDLFVSIPVDRKSDAYDWLQENGLGDIIQSTVNSSTLRAAMKNILKDGVVVPEDVFKLNILNKYKLVKSTRGLPEAAGGG